MKRFSELNITAPEKGFVGTKIKMSKILNKEIKVHAYKVEKSNFPEKGDGNRLVLQLEIDNEKRIAFSSSIYLRDMIKSVPQTDFPFITTIKEVNEHHEFT